MRPLSLTDILGSFDAIDLPLVAAPSLDGVAWDELEFLAWKDPTGHRAYVCVPLPERLVGLVFRLYGGTRRAGGLCDLCLGVERENGTTAAMVDGWLEPRAAFGLHVCSHFDCSRTVRRQKPMDRMSETIAAGHAAERLQQNVERFVRRVTGLRSS
jgi:hypothetical protein